MNTKLLGVAAIALAGSVLIFTPRSTSAAEDGAALYKTKCAMCHGADATGKPAVKAPSLVSDEAKKKSDAELTDTIANGGKEKKAAHAFSKKGVSDDQVKALVAYIRDLQKK
ncbi:MAG TPA: cytochrome c [Candidatus Solibacter sp.]|nr:cytochrome c [Candidatus Solibacter sp.]